MGFLHNPGEQANKGPLTCHFSLASGLFPGTYRGILPLFTAFSATSVSTGKATPPAGLKPLPLPTPNARTSNARYGEEHRGQLHEDHQLASAELPRILVPKPNCIDIPPRRFIKKTKNDESPTSPTRGLTFSIGKPNKMVLSCSNHPSRKLFLPGVVS